MVFAVCGKKRSEGERVTQITRTRGKSSFPPDEKSFVRLIHPLSDALVARRSKRRSPVPSGEKGDGSYLAELGGARGGGHREGGGGGDAGGLVDCDARGVGIRVSVVARSRRAGGGDAEAREGC